MGLSAPTQPQPIPWLFLSASLSAGRSVRGSGQWRPSPADLLKDESCTIGSGPISSQVAAPYPATLARILSRWIPVQSLFRLGSSRIVFLAPPAAAATPESTTWLRKDTAVNWRDATREHSQRARQGRRGNPTACQPTASLLASARCAVLCVAAAAIAASLPVAAAAEVSVAPAMIA